MSGRLQRIRAAAKAKERAEARGPDYGRRCAMIWGTEACACWVKKERLDAEGIESFPKELLGEELRKWGKDWCMCTVANSPDPHAREWARQQLNEGVFAVIVGPDEQSMLLP